MTNPRKKPKPRKQRPFVAGALPHTPKVSDIEQGVTVPVGSTGRRSKYPFGRMVPGDSFLVEGVARHKMRAAISSHKKRYNGTAFHIETDEKTGGLRIWRDK